MRAKEFTINIPINIKIDDDEPRISAAQPSVPVQTAAAPQPTQKPVDDTTDKFIPPLQQSIELQKKQAGVKSEFDQEAVKKPQN